MNRRSFLRNSTAATAGLALPVGLAASPQNTSKKVIVLGAGLAGLTAAWELVQAGHEVIIFEARNRTGGRLLTLREGLTPGLTAEAGGMTFNDNYFNLLRYVKLFDIPYESLSAPVIPRPFGNMVYHLQGKRIVSNNGKVDWPLELKPEEREGSLFKKYIQPLVGNVKDVSISDLLFAWARSIDNKTLLELVSEKGASAGAQEIIRVTSWFADRDGKASAAWNLLPVAQAMGIKGTYGFPGGADHLSTAFTVRLGERIRFGVEVLSIKNNPSNIEVVVNVAGKQESVTADRIVCTIPFSVLRNLDINPSLSANKREIIARMYYMPVNRVFLEVKNRFWEKKGENALFLTDLPIGNVEDHPMIRTGREKERGILEAHTRGADALRVDEMSGAKRLAFVLEQVKKVHPEISDFYEGGISKSWQLDPYSAGAYSVFLPGQITSWFPEITRPEGRIHFAGEHTSIYSASMEGAIESGVRAAKEIGKFK